MSFLTGRLRYLAVLVIMAAVCASFWWAVTSLNVNSDITAALPADDPVVSASRQIFKHHPALEKVFIDLSIADGNADKDTLLDAGDLVKAALEESNLVHVVSIEGGMKFLAALLDTVTRNLPLFFGQEDLNTKVMGLLEPGEIRKRLQHEYRQLFELGNMGQAEYLSKDPLGLKNLVLARLSSAIPFQGSELHRGHIMSKDGRHLLIIAEPLPASRGHSFAPRMTEALERASDGLNKVSGAKFRMIYAGAFRAALDNEMIIRRDMSRALVVVAIGVALLTLICFRRPWIGLMAMVPAMAGGMLATFVYALTNDSIFGLTMGFGGALMGIAVDHGLAYVVLLDRPYDTWGASVSREVWSVGSFPVLDTVVALLALTLTGIPLFAELGLFAALGVGLASLFVHVLFPLLFPHVKGSRRKKPMLMERLMDWLVASCNWWTVAVFSAFALVMLFFVRFDFSIDLNSMNTLSQETREAEQIIEKTWGGFSGKAYVMAKGRSVDDLWREAERLGEFMQKEKDTFVLGGELPRATFLPGPKAQEANLKAWQDFWRPERVSALEKVLAETGVKVGFRDDAFDPFLLMLRAPKPVSLSIPGEMFPFLGVFPDVGNSGWILVDAISPGPQYRAESFFERATQSGFTFFDPGHFSRHLAGYLNASFIKMLLIFCGACLVLYFIFFMDWQVSLVTIAPLAFSLVATLGTMGLLGLPLSIPSLILAPMLVGIGTDYSVYFVRSYQQFGAVSHPDTEAFRLTVMLSALTTLIGTGSLVLSEHVVLRDAGITTSLGIFFSMAGTLGILPPLVRRLFAPAPLHDHQVAPGSKEHTKLALSRFKHLAPYPRLFARFKILLDPMFPRLADFIEPGWKVIDVGCGYGVPATWLLALYPDLRFLVCDPSQERIRIAGRVLGRNGRVFHGGVLDLPLETETPDAVLLLDMLHYISNNDLLDFLARVRPLLHIQGRLIIRVTIPTENFSFLRFVEVARMKLRGQVMYFRSREEMLRILDLAGFRVDLTEPSAPNREETWFIASMDTQGLSTKPIQVHT